MKTSSVLAIYFSGIIFSGIFLLSVIVLFMELQTAFHVILGFGLLVGGGLSLSMISWKQDVIDNWGEI